MEYVENGIYLDPVRFIRLEKKCGRVYFVNCMDFNPVYNQCGLDFEPIKKYGVRCNGIGL
ncbi:hypothetical protein PoMZ_02581 [Pyricularia oryzae]|uniref:Uncharacterized protein n=1 Tax=Pyricularia oryzae TaxID=318829 RepID=A0A4P7N547_PYROR|nr:hypothetical protein PoMZ_02581 [Pyricularia oryzae]